MNGLNDVKTRISTQLLSSGEICTIEWGFGHTHTHHSKTHTDPIFQHTKACPKNTLAQHPTQNYTWIKNDVICLYRIIHKGWDCKDDLKLSKYGDFLIEFNLLTWIKSFKDLFNDLTMNEPKQTQLKEVMNLNPLYLKMDCINTTSQ